MAPRRRVIYAEVTEQEYALVRRAAERDGLTVAGFLRACVNASLDEESELLQERVHGFQRESWKARRRAAGCCYHCYRPMGDEPGPAHQACRLKQSLHRAEKAARLLSV